MVNYWNIINRVIADADVIVEVMDARMVDDTRNWEIELKVKKSGKPLIYALNKSDLVDKTLLAQRKRKLNPCVYISAKEHYGISKLREKILSKSGSKKIVKVGILGYPNTGKSSVINALSPRGKVKTSSQSGHTRGKQEIRASRKLKIIDTPGVIPFKEKDSSKHAIISAIDYAHAKDPDLVVMELMKKHPGKIEKYYDVERMDELDDVLMNIAIKFNKIMKKGEPDIEAVSRMILRHWQEGKII